MKRELRAGDVVRLRSGGPEMTVTGPLLDGDVDVVWFSDEGEYYQDELSPESLILLRAIEDDQ